MCMKIVNLTPHPITILSEEDIQYNPMIRKWTTSKKNVVPIAQIPSQGLANAKTSVEHCDPINGIPVMRKALAGVDPLPSEESDTIFVVSALYATSYRKLYPESKVKLYTIADPVYTEDGRTVLGSRGICEAF